MPITKNDIKLVASQVMADVPNGGGVPTANVIADAASNAIFPDISELDRAGGRVNARKVFLHVQTPTLDGYYGANMIVAKPPADPNVSVTIFSTGQMFDRRTNATDRMESYLAAGPEIAGFLFENHIAGQRSIQLLMRANGTPPPVGRTLLLRKREGYGDQVEQYVRLTRVETETREFTYASGTSYEDYEGLVVTCDLSDALLYDFPGTSANRSFARGALATVSVVRDTVVADAGNYFGAVPLAAAAAIGDVSVTAGSVYTQLVPNARSETPVTDQRPSAAYLHQLATSPRAVSVGGAPFSQRIRIGQENRGFNYVTILTPLPAPGSLRVVFRTLGRAYTLTDDGAGNLTGSGSGTVNYLTGSVSVTLEALPDDRSAVMFYWGPNTAYTNRTGQAGFRQPSYSFSAEHDNITPGSVSISWTSGGVTKTATDNGTGKLTGDAAGEVVYATGLVSIRPTAMLDAGGEFEIDYTWAAMVEEALTGLSPDGTGSVAITFAQIPVPGTIRASWLTTRNVSNSSGASNTFSTTNKASMTNSSSSNTTKTEAVMVDTPTLFKKPSAIQYGAQFGYEVPDYERDVVVDANGDPLVAIYNSNSYVATVRAPQIVTSSHSTSGTGSSSTSTGATYMSLSEQTSKTSVTVAHVVTDDGAGSFYGTFGTINYGAGTASLKVQSDFSETSYKSNYEDAKEFETLNATGESTTTVGGAATTSTSSGGGGNQTAKGGQYGTQTFSEAYGTATLVVRYQTGSPTPTAHTETYTPPGVSIDLCPYTTDIVVPGSVRFTWMGHVYEDFEGVVYRGRTPVDPGIPSGRMLYSSGIANLTDYVVGGPATAFTLDSLWTRKPRGHVANVTFSTSLSPIKPTGLSVSVLDTTGAQILATANLAGEVVGPHCHGVIDYDSGLVELQFGDYVIDSALTAAQKAEWWYDANDVRTSDGKIWRPWPVDPETLRYNAVAYFYLPLDASILGLNPVRLPQDGRVPIFRPGGFAVLGHTGEVGPSTVSNGQTINCGRVRLSWVRVIGNDGLVINTGYTEDLDLGTVTFTDVSGYSQPVLVQHRIEDMAMVAEVQINGTLSFTREITHAYPVPGSYVSSALVAGDLQSYVSVLFDMATWANVWADSFAGTAATGTYNDGLAPIELTNEGAVTERWLIRFTNVTTFDVIGEHVGVIAQGTTSADCAPVNPATGHPYFTLRAIGWGGGWASGNCLRFNTVGTIFPVWVVRTVQQGEAAGVHDSFTIIARGDIDRP